MNDAKVIHQQRIPSAMIPIKTNIYKTSYKLKTVISHEILSNSGQYLYQTVPNNDTSTILTK